MKLHPVIIPLFLFASGCAPQSPSGVIRPSISSDPRSYLRGFPLGKVTEDELLQQVGSPTRTHVNESKRLLTYDIATKHNPGVLEYTYVIQKNVVQDVTYTNAGNFFGVVQRESASSLQR
jgi:hypothetical protein